MKYILIILLLLVGCYTSKKADRAINKAYDKYPELVAKKSAKLFPVKSDSIEIVKWRLQVDSLFNDSINDAINCNDSIIFKDRLIEKIKYKVKNMPAIYRIDSAYIYRNNKELSDMEKSRDSYKTKAEIYFRVLACIFGLVILFLVAYFIKK